MVPGKDYSKRLSLDGMIENIKSIKLSALEGTYIQRILAIERQVGTNTIKTPWSYGAATKVIYRAHNRTDGYYAFEQTI